MKRFAFSLIGCNGPIARTLSALVAERGHAQNLYSHEPKAGQLRYDLRNSAPRELRAADGAAHIFVLSGGLSKVDQCAQEPFLSTRMNITAPLEILERIRELGGIPVFLSTDNVFDGSNGPYSEESPVRPINVYGLQKSTIEAAIRSSFKRHLILRMSKVISSEPGNVLVQQADALRKGLTIPCFHDQSFAPVFQEDVARFILAALDRDCQGTFHLAQDLPLSRLEQGWLLSDHLGVPRDRVVSASIEDARLPERRPKHVHLLNHRAKNEVGFRFRTFEQVLELLPRS